MHSSVTWGQHAVYLAGFIDNNKLATIAPPNLSQRGDWGGYYIIENSWEPNTGDATYYYLSYSCFLSQAMDIFAIPAATI